MRYLIIFTLFLLILSVYLSLKIISLESQLNILHLKNNTQVTDMINLRNSDANIEGDILLLLLSGEKSKYNPNPVIYTYGDYNFWFPQIHNSLLNSDKIYLRNGISSLFD